MNSDAKTYLQPKSLETEFRDILSQRYPQRQSRSWLKQVKSALLLFLTGQQTISIRKKIINQQKTGDSEVKWIVYDSLNNRRNVFETEQAVRVWLEQKPHR
ncbi:MAG: hypothetical protein AAF703_04770 [Cyanobacteria bacterium P01_D01_bin.105]